MSNATAAAKAAAAKARHQLADTLDATQALAAQEFQAQLAGLLDAARKLGLDRRQIVDRVERALSSEKDISQSTTNPDRRKPE